MTFAPALLLLLLAPAPQSDPPDPALRAWRARHGAEWILRTSPRTQTGRLLFGGHAAARVQPIQDAEWEFAARDWVEEAWPMLRIAESSLVLRQVKHLRLERIGTSDKTAVVFDQVVNGIPVAGGAVSVLFGPGAELLAVDTTGLPGVERMSTLPVLPAGLAEAAAREEFARIEGRMPAVASPPQLVIHPHDDGRWVRPRLAWVVEVADPGPLGRTPAGHRVTLAADTPRPEVLAVESLVHPCFELGDVVGHVQGNATPADPGSGYLPDAPANPPVLQGMPFMDLTSPAGNATTDANGDFTIPGAGTNPVDVTFSFAGTYVRVENQAGANHSETVSFTPGLPGTATLNAGPTEFVTAQVNAFVQVNRVREWIRSVDPADPTMDLQVLAKVNADGSSFAWFWSGILGVGRSINFNRADSQGMVHPNLAYSTVIAHEEGHWANEVYGTSNDPRGIGEGVADVWAMYVHDTALVGDGNGLFPPRDGRNLRPFCGDASPGCHADKRENGEVLMGALWKVRDNLNTTYGNAVGDDIANLLFLSWLQVYDDTLINTLIRDHWLILDDDDGDILNGTPHGTDIQAAFEAQGFPPIVPLPPSGVTERVSVNSAGVQGNSGSLHPSISADGRHVAFYSSSSNLVPGDTNGGNDVFVHDRQAGTTERVSVDSAGVEGNSDSTLPRISADGRHVAFYSRASNLVAGDTNGAWDVFVHDRQAGTTERVSVDSSGVQGDSDSILPRISADGRHVAFRSYASNLVPGDTNGAWDVFVHDRQAGTTERVSVDSAGVQGNSDSYWSDISADGLLVAFNSYASNLVAGDTNGFMDVFVHDRQARTTERVSVDSAGVQGNSGSTSVDISADGRHVAFNSSANNLVAGDTNSAHDVFVHDRQAGTTERVSVNSAGGQGNYDSSGSDISANGRHVAFYSYASNLVAGDTNSAHDVFVHDRKAGTTERMSVNSAGVQGNSGGLMPSISADGRNVAFHSLASNLVPGDTNGRSDVFVHDRGLIEPFLVQGALVRNQMSWFEVRGALPAELVYYLASPTGLGAGPCPIALGGLCLDLLPPVLPIGVVAADVNGTAVLEGWVPGLIPISTLYTQAAIPRGPSGLDSVKTNAVSAPIVP